MKVLIADGSAAERARLEKCLAGWGYERVMAEDGAAAWDILAKPDGPAMAILEWDMRRMTGPAVCRKVREIRRGPYVYILLLTRRNSKEETLEGWEAGADDYIVKPFDEQELSVRVRGEEDYRTSTRPDEGSRRAARQGRLTMGRWFDNLPHKSL